MRRRRRSRQRRSRRRRRRDSAYVAEARCGRTVSGGSRPGWARGLQQQYSVRVVVYLLYALPARPLRTFGTMCPIAGPAPGRDRARTARDPPDRMRVLVLTEVLVSCAGVLRVYHENEVIARSVVHDSTQTDTNASGARRGRTAAARSRRCSLAAHACAVVLKLTKCVWGGRREARPARWRKCRGGGRRSSRRCYSSENPRPHSHCRCASLYTHKCIPAASSVVACAQPSKDTVVTEPAAAEKLDPKDALASCQS